VRNRSTVFRIILTPDKEMEGLIEEDIIREIIEKIEVPR
jgi:hypothetical protein